MVDLFTTQERHNHSFGGAKCSNPGVNPVAIGLEDKKAIVAEVNETATSALSLVIADSRGVTVDGMTALRATARENKVTIRVVRNTLAKRALQGTDFACMEGGLIGPLVLAFSQEDPGSVARVAQAFAKEHDKFQVKLIAVGGKLLDPSELGTLATMPTYEEAIGLLMAVMKAPVQKLAATINEVPGKLVRTLAAVRDAKEAA
jgi:large subunit ribosomal protein L10